MRWRDKQIVHLPTLRVQVDPPLYILDYYTGTRGRARKHRNFHLRVTLHCEAEVRCEQASKQETENFAGVV